MVSQDTAPVIVPRHSRLSLFLCVAFLLLVLYALSIGPMLRFVSTRQSLDVAPPAWYSVTYQPLYSLMRHVRPLYRFYNWYFRQLGADRESARTRWDAQAPQRGPGK